MKKQPEVREKTRKKLIDAFFELGKDKNINQISVGELTRLAGYNRSTFYEYFMDMPDLIGQAEDELLAQIQKNISEGTELFISGNPTENIDAFHFIFSMLNEPIYCLLGPHGDPSFFPRVREVVSPVLSGIFRGGNLPEHFDYIAAFAYSAVIGYLQHWHDCGQDMPEKEFFELGYRLLTGGVLGVLTREG